MSSLRRSKRGSHQLIRVVPRSAMHRLLGLCCGCALLTAILDQPCRVLAQMRAKGAFIPIFLEPEPKAVAVVRIKDFFTEYQRHGFFRIGLLPQVVADGVTLELRQTGQITNALRAIRRGILAGKSTACFEVRDISIKLSVDSAPLLQARQLHFGETGQWQFTDGVVFREKTNQIHFAKGALQTAGPSAGQFCFQYGDASATVNLFSISPPIQTAPKIKESL